MLKGLTRLLDHCLPADLPHVADRSALHRGRAMAAILLITFANGAIGSGALLVQAYLDRGFAPAPLLFGAVGLQLVFALSLWLLRRFAAIRAAALLCAMVITAYLFLLIAATGGPYRSPLTFFLFVQPFVLFIVLGRREALGLLIVVVLMGIALSGLPVGDHSLMSPEIEAIVRRVWFGPMLAVFACFWYLDHVNRRLTEVISHERDLAQFAAGHDPLTGLLNRASLEQRVEVALSRADLQGYPVTLLMIDLDDFKEVNDRHGHQAGDYLLQTLATRIRESVRHNDSVARLGGDEFALLLEGEVPTATTERIINTLLTQLATGIDYRGQALQVSASIGGAVCPDDARDQQALMRCADVALYQAKNRGRNNAVWFDALALTSSHDPTQLSNTT